MLLEPLIQEFLRYLLVEKGYSPLTITSYRSDLKFWLRNLSDQAVAHEVAAIEPRHLRSFIASLSEAGLKPATVRRRFDALRSFWNYLVDNDYTPKNPCRRISTPKKEERLPVYLSIDEVNALLAATDRNHYVYAALRDRAVLSMLVHTGLRRAELLAVKLRDVDLNQRLVFVRRGKGGKERVIPICDALHGAISEYLEARPDAPHDYLFLTRERKPLGRTGLTGLFQKALKNSGIDKEGITIHKLRHTFATMLLRSGCDLVGIQKLLGHRSIETTAIYLHADMESLRSAVGNLPSFSA